MAAPAAASPAGPTTARVVQYSSHGDASVMESWSGRCLSRREKQVLVSVRCTSVNPIDFKLREGMGGLGGWLAGARLPAVPGGDVAGTVVEADASSPFKPGDPVFALLPGYVGAYASAALVPEAALARIPEGMSFEQAAALPLVALTACQVLEAARVPPGGRVLIHAGSGGVGTVLIQMAKARGLRVATTASAANADLVRGLGADEVCDYKSQAFEEVFKEAPFDAVVDTAVRHSYEERSLKLVKRGGTYAQILVKPRATNLLGFLRGAAGLGPRYRVVRVGPNGAQLAQVAELFRQGKLPPVIDRVLPLFEKAGEAQDITKAGHNRGKIVLRVEE